MLLKNILENRRILRDSTNHRVVLTPFVAFLGGPLTQKKEKSENRGLSLSIPLRESTNLQKGLV
jgi:hypothetical protein